MSYQRDGWQTVDIYEDTGCADLGIPSCLSCWLPACRFDLPPKQAGALVRAARVRELLRQGLTVDEIAAEMGTSRRTVFRLKHWCAALTEVRQ